MGTPGPTVHARKKLLKIVMHPTPNSLPIHSLQSLSLCLPQFLLMFDKWRLVTCLARDHVYMTYFLVSCLYSNFTDIFLYLDKWWLGGGGGLAWLLAMFTRSVTSRHLTLLSVYTHSSFDDSYRYAASLILFGKEVEVPPP